MSIAFSWHGLPQYAARQLRSALAQLGQPCTVIGTRPAVPIQGMEAALGQPIHWVEASRSVRWADLGLATPKVFFQAGWSCPAFNAMGDEVRAAGGRVCLLMDNDWRGDLRQWFGGLWFRLARKRKFAAVLVPGLSGRRLARWYDFADEEIAEGLYGADPTVFFDGPPLAARPKRILFVGQYIERKDCVGLATAFASVADQLPEWELHLYGSGPLQGKIPTHPRIQVHGFVQPAELGALYRSARIFALPSHSEAWGLVVHEAALSGCQLLLSAAIGSRHDFATQMNAAEFPAGNAPALAQAILRLASSDDYTLGRAQAQSRALAATHSPAVFADRVAAIVKKLS
ncbi:MAG: glycosyltransferase [Verrucomicrobiota bacterium]